MPGLRNWWKRDTIHAQQAEAARAALQQQLAVAQAIESERQRIYDDLHDDVGSR